MNGGFAGRHVDRQSGAALFGVVDHVLGAAALSVPKGYDLVGRIDQQIVALKWCAAAVKLEVRQQLSKFYAVVLRVIFGAGIHADRAAAYYLAGVAWQIFVKINR